MVEIPPAIVPKFCAWCGSKLRKGARFCTECGTQVATLPGAEGQSFARQPTTGQSKQLPTPGPSSLNGGLSSKLPIRCFLSYHREDNVEAFPGAIDRFFRELLSQLKAEAPVEVFVFRDIEAMVGGEGWRRHVDEAIAATNVFIPVVTTRWFQSQVCMEELHAFRTNTPPDELQTAVLPLILAGHRNLRDDAAQEEVRFIESLHWRDLGDSYRRGYESPQWRMLVADVVNDILTWHEGFAGRHETFRTLAVKKLDEGKLRLGEQFLTDVGLEELPAEQQLAFLQHVYAEMEIRTGERLTEGMTDEQIDEFGYFVDMDVEGMTKWYQEHLPAYSKTEAYRQLREANPDAPESAIMAEHGAMMWLAMNCPNYPALVAAVFNELKEEIAANRTAILEGEDEE
jgi:hypothetical protein